MYLIFYLYNKLPQATLTGERLTLWAVLVLKGLTYLLNDRANEYDRYKRAFGAVASNQACLWHSVPSGQRVASVSP